MARLESVLFIPHRASIIENNVQWSNVKNGSAISDLPLIFWSNGKPWREANLWTYTRASNREVRQLTVASNASSLLTYAKWLEATGTDWCHFPERKADRCLVQYRGALIDARDRGELAPSTVTQRMRVVVNFYRWLSDTGLISPNWPMWKERTFGFRLVDPLGFERTINVQSTDLSITNRTVIGDRLEDGLYPITSAHRDATLEFARSHASEELFQILSLGFFTGMRLGTITDIKVQTLHNAMPDPSAPGLFKIAVGPGADPPVATKFGVTGHIWITGTQLKELLTYAYSVRRLKREAKAESQFKDLVFLTRYGNPYARRGSDKSVAVNVELYAFKKLAIASGIHAMRGFRFHQTRSTFATELARIAISVGGGIAAVAILKESLLHRREETSLKYVKFVEKSPIKEAASNAFTREFLGLISNRESKFDE